MIKKIIAASAIFALALSAYPAGAQKEKFSLPAKAVQVAEDEYDLGLAVDRESGQLVTGRAIIHRDKKFARQTNPAKTQNSRCYGYIVRGTKWRTVEPWVMNPANTSGLDGASLFNTQTGAIAKWEDATDGIVGNSAGVDVIGDGSTTADTLIADESSPDGQNEVYFADVDSTGAIAVTIIWYNTFTKSFVEWDQIYDDIDFDWSLAGEVGKMDFDNIATHEDGHSAGLDDLYRSRCAEETMYGYATEGETKKRDLNLGDISGIDALY